MTTSRMIFTKEESMKKSACQTIPALFLFVFLVSSQIGQAKDIQLRPGKTYHGFRFIKEKQIKEYDAVGRVFEHVRTGARLLKLESSDDNKSFCITFKFLPKDDTGVAHILEHATLNSSKNFPVKSPIQMLFKGSLQTFANAFTSHEYVMYPIASRNQNDFFNLMNVYLDMVFNPLMYQEKNIFLQEGWRYELGDKNQELTYNGIVYNEMKGNYSSPQQILMQKIRKNLLPKTIYAHDMGGDPEKIPYLDYKEFLALHKKYFHPSNSYITLYGDGNTLEELKFIHEKYLSKFKKTKIQPVISLQKAFKQMKQITLDYPIGKNEDTQDKTFLSLSFVAGSTLQPELSMAMDVLTDLLVNLPAAPIRKALQEAGIGKDVSCGYDDSKQGVFTILVDNANPEDKDRFLKTVLDTLGQVIKSGLEKKQVEGVLNRLEFKLREADFGSFPKGLVATATGIRGWIIGKDPFLTMQWEKPLTATRAALKTDYLEKIIAKHFLKNSHALLVALRPKAGLTEEIAAKTQKKLAALKASMSATQIEALIDQTKKLKKWQMTPDSPEAIGKMPMLGIADLNPKAEDLKVLEKQIGKAKVLHFPIPTNGIIYLQLFFDASGVPQEMIDLLPILSDLLGKLDTKQHPYGELNSNINIHTGGIQITPDTFSDFKNPDDFMRRLSVSGKVLTAKLDNLLDLQSEIIHDTQMSNQQRIQQVLTEINAGLQGYARNAGQNLAVSRLAARISPLGAYSERIKGLTHIHFVEKLTKDFDTKANDLVADLEMLRSLVFNQNNLIVGITCSDEDYQKFEQQFPPFLKRLADKHIPPQTLSFSIEPKNEALLSSSKVQYVIKATNYHKRNYAYSGKLHLLTQILSWDYLIPKIRMEGGAYGAWVFFARNGMAAMGSYRDPHIRKTLDVYTKAPDFVRGFKADKREITRSIIGTIATLDKPMTPSLKGSTAIEYHLENVTLMDRQKERDELLGATLEDINQLADMLTDLFTQANICVYGNEEKIKAQKDLFDDLLEVIN